MIKSMTEDSWDTSSEWYATHFISPPWPLLLSASDPAQVSVLTVTCKRIYLMGTRVYHIGHKSQSDVAEVEEQNIVDARILTVKFPSSYDSEENLKISSGRRELSTHCHTTEAAGLALKEHDTERSSVLTTVLLPGRSSFTSGSSVMLML